MIKIIKGTYGYEYKAGRVKNVTSADGPISLDPQAEKRLVEKKIAEYVTDAPLPSDDDIAEEKEIAPVQTKPAKKTGKKAKAKAVTIEEEADEEAPELLAEDPV